MAKRRTEALIARIRRETGNLDTDGNDFATSNGIGDGEIVEYLNDAVAALEAAILQSHPQGMAREEKLIDIVANQESYDIPLAAVEESGIVAVYYSPTGNTTDFYPLDQALESERSTQFTGEPDQYIRSGRKILLNPIPQTSVTGGLRVKYVRRAPRLSKRYGPITAVTVNTSTRVVTSVTIADSAQFNSTYDYINVVDFYGTMKMANLPVASGTFTILSGHVYEVGESIAIGDYITYGAYTSTHHSFPESVERFLVASAKRDIYERDNNENSAKEDKKAKEYLEDIKENWADLSEDIFRIPDINRNE